MEQWWKKETVYQIYPLSFCDSDANGYGDIKGIISKLDYIKTLGAGIIWLSPVYQSPMDDNGYDISDYYAINPLFGTMTEFDTLLLEVHKRGLKLVMDLVVNHTSDEHPWFMEAKKSKSSKYRDYYIWSNQPTLQQSVFSGSAWEYEKNTEQYYFHLFSRRQPDLNWDNPELREEIYKMINWWLDKGIDGFRLDVIDLIGKEVFNQIMCNGPKLHERLREMHERCFKGRTIITVGETPCADITAGSILSAPENRELDMIFNFQHISLDQQPGKSKWELAPLDLLQLKHIFEQWQTGLFGKGWNSLFWCNHDQPRVVSRFGNDAKYRTESAKMLATALHFMQGTPYVYQGEELGMTNIKLEDIHDYKDIETLNMYQEFTEKGFTHEQIMHSVYAKGRDNARTPMQWDDSEQAGFTKGKPWLPVNPNYREINAKKAMADENSVFKYYQKLIAMRKTLDIITSGSFRLLMASHPQVYAYERMNPSEKLVVVCNFQEAPCSIQMDDVSGEYLIGNYPEPVISTNMTLRPFECFVVRKRIHLIQKNADGH